VKTLGDIRFAERLSALDLVIETLRQHEKALDKITERLEKLADAQRGKWMPIRQFTCNICGEITQITDYDNPNHYTSLEEDKICESCLRLFPKELIDRLRNK